MRFSSGRHSAVERYHLSPAVKNQLQFQAETMRDALPATFTTGVKRKLNPKEFNNFTNQQLLPHIINRQFSPLDVCYISTLFK